MKFILEESYTTEKEITELVIQKIAYVNKQLDELGFELEYVDDYDFSDDSDEWLAVFCSDIQDNASVFPISVNISLFLQYALEDAYIANDLPYHIEKSIWHEVGHGIQNYLLDEFDYDDIERSAEEYAEFMMDENSHSDIYDDMKEYLTENE